MKYIVLLVLSFVFYGNVKAQSNEAQQLLLNYEKLRQMKNMLSDMKRGYDIVKNGYNSVKNLAEGNFNIHDAFLGKLMSISPMVKNYQRIPDIIDNQKNLIREYKQAFNIFSKSNLFENNELKYISNVYKNLIGQSIQNLDDLTLIITTNKLQMNDEERLKSIDRIFEKSEDRLTFLKSFNRQTQLLLAQRNKDRLDLKHVQNLYPLNN